MSDTLTSMQNLRFLLYEMLNIEELTALPRHEDHSRETFDMALDTADQLAREVFWPALQELDRQGMTFEKGQVRAPQVLHDIWKQCKDGGWFAPTASYDMGGQQFPVTIYAAVLFLFNAANPAAAIYITAGGGTARLIETFASEDLVNRYVPKLYSGEWTGTMALTEPDVGTSLGDIKTTAVKAPDGDHYLIKGTKRFITGGDHDLAANIIHPVLAKIEGAPPGVKGISLFIVPKYRVDDGGNVGEFNDVVTAGIEHKLGINGSATATLIFGENDNCHGWLIGEPNSGLKCMFQLMNHARAFTGLQAMSGASAAYQRALQYTRERVQGRDIMNRDPLSPQIPIIEHADVRRMLLIQKAFVEASLGLVLYCAKRSDIMESLAEGEERENVNLLLELLTPCCKAHCSDGAFQSISLALQCFGGAGYCEEFPVAQMLRDSRVFPIYEGANGIQAMDLLGRKVPMRQGNAVRLLMAEISKTAAEATALEPLKPLADKLNGLQEEVGATTMHLAMLGMSGEVPLFICNATPFLEMFSQMILSWQLLMQAVVAQKVLDADTNEEAFYRGKVETARFYINTVVPHALATAQILKSNERTHLDFKPEWFS